MGKGNCRWQYCLPAVAIFLAACILSAPLAVYAQEEREEENPVYDRLKSRIEAEWNDGMEMIGETNPIEISGNFPERLLCGIAVGLYRNLRSIKAGSLLAGGISFLLGVILAMLSRKDKKIRKMAVGVCMCAVPAILLVFVFGISWYISFFR